MLCELIITINRWLLPYCWKSYNWNLIYIKRNLKLNLTQFITCCCLFVGFFIILIRFKDFTLLYNCCNYIIICNLKQQYQQHDIWMHFTCMFSLASDVSILFTSIFCCINIDVHHVNILLCLKSWLRFNEISTSFAFLFLLFLLFVLLLNN